MRKKRVYSFIFKIMIVFLMVIGCFDNSIRMVKAEDNNDEELDNDKIEELDQVILSIEKYVNKAVHAYITSEESFEFDIIVRVPNQGDKLEISDSLSEDFLFDGDETSVSIYDLGTEVNHLPARNIGGDLIHADASVLLEDGDVNTLDDYKVKPSENAKITIANNTLRVIIDNKDEGQYLNSLANHYIRINFEAKLAQDVDFEQEFEPIVENDPVDSDETHKGIINNALAIVFDNDEELSRGESNSVTVKVEQAEIEKYVDKAVHKAISFGDKFDYDILVYVTEDADALTIEDTLNDQLAFFSSEDEIKVYDLGEVNNHLPKNDIYGNEKYENATVAQDDLEPIPSDNVKISKNGKTLTVNIDDYNLVKNLRGHWLKLSFSAQLDENFDGSGYEYVSAYDEDEDRNKPNVGNNPVVSEEDHTGLINNASYTISVENKSKYSDVSNKVTVWPDEPEIEKFVNQAVHQDVKIDEEFTYDIVAYITTTADKAVITDTLNAQLQFVGSASDVKVVDLGKVNNHKVTNDINAKQINTDATVAEEGDTINASVDISDKKLTVKLNDASECRGHWIKVTFKAKFADGVVAKDLVKKTIDKNDPVVSKESHTGVVNKAEYSITTGNNAKKDESNTVTVDSKEPEKPDEPDKPDKPEPDKPVEPGKPVQPESEKPNRTETETYILPKTGIE